MDKSIARGILRDIVHHIKAQPAEERKVEVLEEELPEEPIEIEEEEEEEEDEEKPKKRKPLYFSEQAEDKLPTRTKRSR